MSKEKNVFIVTIDGHTHPLAFTTIKGVTHEFSELPYSTLREAFKITHERVIVHGNKIFRVTRCAIARVKGRGAHLNKFKPQKSGE